MSGLTKAIKNLLTYKEPKNTELGFELLEGEYEGIDRETEQKGNATPETEDKSEGKAENVKATNRKIYQPRRSKRKSRDFKVPFKTSERNKKREQDEKESNQIQSDGAANIVKDLKVNRDRVRQEFNAAKNQDIVIREFKVARKTTAFIVFIDGMADRVTINDFILRQLMAPDHFDGDTKNHIMDYIVDSVLTIHETTKEKEFDKITRQILNGLTALFIEGSNECLLIESRGYEKRNVDKPVTETVVRGSQEAFSENLRTNITLLRRIVKNKNLITEIMPVGKTNNSNCAVLYMEGIANPELLNEVKRRIKSIDIDFIESSGMLEQMIEDNPYALFPQMASTERPDRTASFLLEGKVVVIADGAPFANIAPVTFFHMLHTSEDSNLRWYYGTLLRFVRLLGILAAIFLPGLYIAITTFHQEMIPTDLLASIARSRENVPFPTIIEVLLMEISFELIRESGIRMPGVIGTTLGIVGALILGQAAVSANLVTPILIIIVAVTALGNFAIPSYTMAFTIRIIRFVVILFGAIAGFYGISAAIVILGGLTCSMKSFGIPFFAPVAPKTKANPDLIIRQPIYNQKMRPDYQNPLDRTRAGKEPRGWVKSKGGGGE